MADSKNEFLRPICIFVNQVVSVSDNFALPVALHSYSLYVFFIYFIFFLYISLESYFMSGYHFSFCFASKKIVSKCGLAFLSAGPSHLILTLEPLYLHLYSSPQEAGLQGLQLKAHFVVQSISVSISGDREIEKKSKKKTKKQ